MKWKNGKSILNIKYIIAFEFFDRGSLDLTIKHLNCRDPLTSNLPFYVLIETSGSNKDHDEEVQNLFLKKQTTKNLFINIKL